jgi:hypothetical protein
MLMIGVQRLCYRVAPAIARGLGFSYFIRRTAHAVASDDTQWDVEDLFYPGSSRFPIQSHASFLHASRPRAIAGVTR